MSRAGLNTYSLSADAFGRIFRGGTCVEPFAAVSESSNGSLYFRSFLSRDAIQELRCSLRGSRSMYQSLLISRQFESRLRRRLILLTAHLNNTTKILASELCTFEFRGKGFDP